LENQSWVRRLDQSNPKEEDSWRAPIRVVLARWLPQTLPGEVPLPQILGRHARGRCLDDSSAGKTIPGPRGKISSISPAPKNTQCV
jgi:hypothetical protein